MGSRHLELFLIMGLKCVCNTMKVKHVQKAQAVSCTDPTCNADGLTWSSGFRGRQTPPVVVSPEKDSLSAGVSIISGHQAVKNVQGNLVDFFFFKACSFLYLMKM